MQRVLPGRSENIDFDLYPIRDPGSVVRLSLLIFAKVFCYCCIRCETLPLPLISLDLCVDGKLLRSRRVGVCVCVWSEKINENERAHKDAWITVFDSSSEYTSSSEEEIITPNLLVEHDVGLSDPELPNINNTPPVEAGGAAVDDPDPGPGKCSAPGSGTPGSRLLPDCFKPNFKMST